MAFNEVLAERIRQGLATQEGVTEKKLFGCFCFLLHGNVCVGVWKQSLLVRLDLDDYADAFKEPYVKEFNITGRPMKGWVAVEPPGCRWKAWIALSENRSRTIGLIGQSPLRADHFPSRRYHR